MLFPNDKGYIVGCPIWVLCVGNSVYYLVVQLIDDVTYKLSNLVELII